MKAGIEPESDFFILSAWDAQGIEILKKTLDAGSGRGEFVGIGHSMEPTILSGDSVLVDRTSGVPRLGWIVVFPWKDRILTHRVVRTGEGVFWARGDACLDLQGPVDASQIVGRLIGYRRDGRWHSLDGNLGRVAGLLRNMSMSRIRLAAKRWPRLRKLIETDLLRAEIVRGGYSRIVEWLFGGVFVEEETHLGRVVGAVVSDSLPLTQELVDEAKAGVLNGELHLIVAHTPRLRRVGKVLLSKARLEKGVPTGYVSDLLVVLGFRGVGVGRRLLSAVEDAARRDDLHRLVALVERSNVRSLKAFLAAGYRWVPEEELAGRAEEERKSVPADWLLLEKILYEI